MTPRPRIRRWPAVAAAAFALPVFWLVVVADGWTINRTVVAIWEHTGGPSSGTTPDDMAAILNFVMLVPMVFLAAVALPRVRWWMWALAGLTMSLLLEGVQLSLATRNPSWFDVALNSLGALVGAWCGEATNRRLDERRRATTAEA